jgi:salicylate hydroxylase
MMYPDIQLRSSVNCYRAVIDGSILKADPELAPYLEKPFIWWGPGRIVVGIPIQKGKLYSLECTHPGDTGKAIIRF